MFVHKRIWIISSVVCIISAFGFYSLYMQSLPPMEKEEPKSGQVVQDYVNQKQSNIKSQELDLQPIEENIQTTQSNSPKITDSTEMIYQYYYEADGKTVEESSTPPYFIIDLTRDELQKMYSDWQIASFSSQKVVMKKSISSQNPSHFIVGAYEGYVAIFYDNNSSQIELKEITETPISSLPQEEQEKLVEGIEVYGEKELIRILEDYTS